MKVYELDDNVCQHEVFTLGKMLVTIMGYTDGCYS